MESIVVVLIGGVVALVGVVTPIRAAARMGVWCEFRYE